MSIRLVAGGVLLFVGCGLVGAAYVDNTARLPGVSSTPDGGVTTAPFDAVRPQLQCGGPPACP